MLGNIIWKERNVEAKFLIWVTIHMATVSFWFPVFSSVFYLFCVPLENPQLTLVSWLWPERGTTPDGVQSPPSPEPWKLDLPAGWGSHSEGCPSMTEKRRAARPLPHLLPLVDCRPFPAGKEWHATSPFSPSCGGCEQLPCPGLARLWPQKIWLPQCPNSKVDYPNLDM